MKQGMIEWRAHLRLAHALEELLPRQQLVHQHGEAVHVGRLGHLALHQELGRHVPAAAHRLRPWTLQLQALLPPTALSSRLQAVIARFSCHK